MFTSVRLQPFGKTSVWVCMVPSGIAYPSFPYVPLVCDPYHAFKSSGTTTVSLLGSKVKFLMAHGSMSYIYFPSDVLVQLASTS